MAMRNRFSGLLVGGLLLLSQTLWAADEVELVDSVSVNKTRDGYEVTVLFNEQVQLVEFTPDSPAQQLFINLRHISPDINEPARQRLLSFNAGDDSPLTSVLYREDDNGYDRLEFAFRKPQGFTVRSLPDMRGIVIRLFAANRPLASAQQEAQAAALMKQARTQLIDERNFPAARDLYQQVLGLPDNAYSQNALEFLGLVYERMGKPQDAVQVYEQYLQLYPQGSDAERVHQRWMSLASATQPLPEKRRPASDERPAAWQTSASLAQYYYRDTFSVNSAATEVTASLLNTDLDIASRYRSDSSEDRVGFSAGYSHDFLNKSSSQDRTTRVSSAYLEHRDNDNGWWVKGGRQTSSRDGVMGRFDGVRLGYDLTPSLQLVAVAGFPVASAYDGPAGERSFSGLSLNMGPYADHWEFSLYALEQTNQGLIDRRAVGGEVRYFRPELSLVSLLDYDIFYHELNVGSLLFNWNASENTQINATLDQRKLPMLTTENALQGQITSDFQAVRDIRALRDLYSDQDIYRLARDRTADAFTGTLGFSHALSSSVRLSSDINLFNVSATAASGGVAATPASGDQYAWNAQLTAAGLYSEQDVSHLGWRLSSTSTSSSWGVFGGSRFPLSERWQLFPRLSLDHVDWTQSNNQQWRLQPKIRAEYSTGPAQLEMELGAEWNNSQLQDGSEQSRSVFAVLGYRYEF